MTEAKTEETQSGTVVITSLVDNKDAETGFSGFVRDLAKSIDRHGILYPILVAKSSDPELDQTILDGQDRLEVLLVKYKTRASIPKEYIKEVEVKDIVDFHEKRLESIVRRKQCEQDKTKLANSLSVLLNAVAEEERMKAFPNDEMTHDGFVNKTLKYEPKLRSAVIEELCRRTNLSRSTVYRYLPEEMKRKWEKQESMEEEKSQPETFTTLYECPYCRRTIEPGKLKEVHQQSMYNTET